MEAPGPGTAPEDAASHSPSAYRQKNPYVPPPREYKPPSLLAEHKVLAIVFATLSLAFVGYCWKAPHATPRRGPPIPVRAAGATGSSGPLPAAQARQPDQGSAPAGPIYVEAVPDKQ